MFRLRCVAPLALFAGHAALGAGNPSAAITAGSITTPTLNVSVAPAAPGFSISYAAPGGLKSVSVTLTSAETAQSLTVSFPPPPLTDEVDGATGTLALQDPVHSVLGLYAAPGTWKLTAATICGQGHTGDKMEAY